MAVAMLDEMHKAMAIQAKEMAALRRRVDACNEEIAVLLRCLGDAGVVRHTMFLVQLQRHRFNTSRAAHPFAGQATLEDVMEIDEIAVAAAFCAGFSAAREVASASRAMSRCVKRVWPLVIAKWPRSIYVCGGHDGVEPLDIVERFRPLCRRWDFVAPMIHKRSAASAGVVNGRVYVCGGFNGNNALSSAECFDPMIGVWASIPSMSVARLDSSAVVSEGHLYVCGGLGSGGEPLSSSERYDCATHEWQCQPQMRDRRCRAAAGAISRRLYICGGRDDTHTLRSMESFLPSASSWEIAPSMPEERTGATAAVAKGSLYVIGGNSGRRALNLVDRFDPDNGIWTSIAPMLVGRKIAAAAGDVGALGGSWVCVFGGKVQVGEQLLESELLDVESGTWEALPSMRIARESSVAVTALD